jgi:hypothetical protein
MIEHLEAGVLMAVMFTLQPLLEIIRVLRILRVPRQVLDRDGRPSLPENRACPRYTRSQE